MEQMLDADRKTPEEADAACDRALVVRQRVREKKAEREREAAMLLKSSAPASTTTHSGKPKRKAKMTGRTDWKRGAQTTPERQEVLNDEESYPSDADIRNISGDEQRDGTNDEREGHSENGYSCDDEQDDESLPDKSAYQSKITKDVIATDGNVLPRPQISTTEQRLDNLKTALHSKLRA